MIVSEAWVNTGAPPRVQLLAKYHFYTELHGVSVTIRTDLENSPKHKYKILTNEVRNASPRTSQILNDITRYFYGPTDRAHLA